LGQTTVRDAVIYEDNYFIDFSDLELINVSLRLRRLRQYQKCQDGDGGQ